MRLRKKVVLTMRHFLGVSPPCPHPQHRLHLRLARPFEEGALRWRCLDCWLAWAETATYYEPDIFRIDTP